MKQDFQKKCYELVKKIPKGKVSTYKEIAKALNSKAYRAVGKAMANNKHLIKIPCHRVVLSSGKIGNYQGGIERKMEILQLEGIHLSTKNKKIKNLDSFLWIPFKKSKTDY